MAKIKILEKTGLATFVVVNKGYGKRPFFVGTMNKKGIVWKNPSSGYSKTQATAVKNWKKRIAEHPKKMMALGWKKNPNGGWS